MRYSESKVQMMIHASIEHINKFERSNQKCINVLNVQLSTYKNLKAIGHHLGYEIGSLHLGPSCITLLPLKTPLWTYL